MKSNLKNGKYNNPTELTREVDHKEDVLTKNRDLISSLIMENYHKKDKSFISVKELELMREFESNLVKIFENCPPSLVAQLINETSEEFNETIGE
jgi:hypothetical protein